MGDSLTGRSHRSKGLIALLILLIARPANPQLPANNPLLPPGVREFKAGLDASVRSATGRASKEARTVIDHALEEAQKKLDESVGSYLVEIDRMREDALGQIFESIDCTTKNFLREISIVFESSWPLSRSPTLVEDLEKAWKDLRSELSSAMSPRYVKTRYADFLVRASGTYCYVKSSDKTVLPQLDEILVPAREAWATWHRLDGFCRNSSDCQEQFGERLARMVAEGLSAEDFSAPRRLLGMKPEKDFISIESRLGALLREIDVLSDVTVNRRLKAEPNLLAAVSRVGQAEGKLRIAQERIGISPKRSLSTRNRRANQAKEHLQDMRNLCNQAATYFRRVDQEAPLIAKSSQWVEYLATCEAPNRWASVYERVDAWISDYETDVRRLREAEARRNGRR